MPGKKHRVIIDTNLWISYLLTRELSRVDKVFKNNRITLLFSNELLNEFIEVSQRPRLQKFFPAEDVSSLLKEIQSVAEFIEVVSMVDVCRDPKDNFLLALAKDGNASYLVTGDKDLLVLKQFENTSILTISEYLKPNKHQKK